MSFSKIRTKLIVLMIAVMCLTGLALVAWSAIRKPVDRLKEDREVLVAASQALSDLRLEAGRLLVTAPRTEMPRLESALAREQASIAAIEALKAIPSLGEDQAEAVKVVANVGKMAEASFVSLREAYVGIAGSSAADDIPPLNFAALTGADRSAAADLILPLIILNQKAGELSDVVDLGLQSITAQYALVDEGIRKIESRALVLGLVAACFIVVATLAMAILVASGISRTIEGLERKLRTMTEGDLSVRFEARSRDELGRLATSLNSFLDVLGGFHGRIREAAEASKALHDQLQSAVDTAMSSAEEIGASTGSIAKRMEEMDGFGHRSRDAVDAAREAFSSLLSRVEAETRLVSDSAASVTQMLASIGNIARITDANRASAEALVEEAEKGRTVFEESFDRVAGISGSVDVIQEMAAVIKGVAEQTNLLAMNAAIEAAHAGEFGRGFAIVADEIRKLSETASESSRGISQTIAEVTTRIQEAAGTRGATAAAFDAISRRIVEVSRSVTEIHSNVAEMEGGGKQVLDAMTELRERSAEVADRSREFDAATAGLTEGIESFLRLSSEVVANIGEISGGIGYIGESVRGIAGASEGVAAAGERLETEIGRFKA